MKKINLLPGHKQSELYYENLYHAVFIAVIIAAGILLIGVLAQVGVGVYIQNKIKSVQAESENLKQIVNKTENTELKQKIRQINGHMTDFENLYKTAPQWSWVLQAFSQQVPSGIKISRLTADTKTGKVSISGYSPTREQVIELYNNISSDKENFKDIDYPLENVSKPKDIQFNFTFSIQDGVLVPKP